MKYLHRLVTDTWLLRSFWAMAAMLCLYLAFRQLTGVDDRSAQDSWYAMTQALQFTAGGDPAAVYQSLLFDQHIKFQYPPTGLLPLVLFNWLGFEGSQAYNSINGVMLLMNAVLFAWLTFKILPPVELAGVRVPVELVAFMVVFKFYPNHLALVIGQIQVMLNLAFLLACIALLYGRPVVAGILIAGIVAIKPQFAVFGAYALWRRDGQFMVGFLVTGLALLAIAIAMFGVASHVAYVRDVLPFLSRHGECFHLNQSVGGFFSRQLMTVPCTDIDTAVAAGSAIRSSWFPAYNPVVYTLSTLTTVGLLCWPFCVMRRSSDSATWSALSFTSAALAFTMASPIAWVHHFGVMLPLYLFLAVHLLGLPASASRTSLIAASVLSFVLCARPWADPFASTLSQPNWQQSHLMFGVLILFVVLTIVFVRLNHRLNLASP